MALALPGPRAVWSLILINIAGAYLTLCLEVFTKDVCTSWNYARKQITSNKTLHISRLNLQGAFNCLYQEGKLHLHNSFSLHCITEYMTGKNKILLWKYCSSSSSLHGGTCRSSHVRVHYKLQIKQVLLTLGFLSTVEAFCYKSDKFIFSLCIPIAFWRRHFEHDSNWLVVWVNKSHR